MAFTSFSFGAFFLLVLTATWALRRWRAGRNAALILASAWFYGSFDPRFLALLTFSTIVAFAGGEVIGRASAAGRLRTVALWLTNALLLSVLAAFKYYDFFRDNLEELSAWLGVSAHLPLLHLVFPVGISFYTFQGMSYVTDIHRGHGPRAKSLFDFVLYMFFFPKLIIGPICRSRDLLPQIEAEPPEGIPDLSRAVSLLISGVFKKVVIATYLQTHLVDPAFGAPENFSSPELILGLYAYTMQVYADFSAYTDLAVGIGLLLGFHLPDSFRGPYSALTIGEYWRRWHITFSQWLRDYVYFPLGGSRVSAPRSWLNLFLTFLVGGFWHGAQWGYIVWGGMHGVGLAVQKAWRDLGRARGRDIDAPMSPTVAVVSWLATFHLCVFARLFFRAGDLEPAWSYLGAIGRWQWLGEGIDPLVVGLCALTLWMNFHGAALRQRFIEWHSRVPGFARPGVWLAVSAVLLALTPSGVPPYIYFGF